MIFIKAQVKCDHSHLTESCQNTGEITLQVFEEDNKIYSSSQYGDDSQYIISMRFYVAQENNWSILKTGATYCPECKVKHYY